MYTHAVFEVLNNKQRHFIQQQKASETCDVLNLIENENGKLNRYLESSRLAYALLMTAATCASIPTVSLNLFFSLLFSFDSHRQVSSLLLLLCNVNINFFCAYFVFSLILVHFHSLYQTPCTYCVTFLHAKNVPLLFFAHRLHNEETYRTEMFVMEQDQKKGNQSIISVYSGIEILL